MNKQNSEKKKIKTLRLKEYFFKDMENGWNSRCTVLFSKDNGRFHKTQREYFDTNKRFDRFYRDRFEEIAAIGRTKSKKKVVKKGLRSYLSHVSLGIKEKLMLPKLENSASTKKISVLEL